MISKLITAFKKQVKHLLAFFLNKAQYIVISISQNKNKKLVKYLVKETKHTLEGCNTENIRFVGCFDINSI